MDVYGFNLCRADDRFAVPVCESINATTENMGRKRKASPRTDMGRAGEDTLGYGGYYCKYDYDGRIVPNERGCIDFDHVFHYEHATLARLEQCGLIRIWR